MPWKVVRKGPTIDEVINQITDQVVAQYAEYVENLIGDIAKAVREKLEKTVEHWAGGSAQPVDTYNNKWPVPKFIVDVVKKSDTEFRLTVVTDSWLWTALDQGTQGHVSRGETFLPRPSNRTIPGTLEVNREAGYGDLIHVPEGSWIEGIEPRGWSEVIVDEILEEFGTALPGLTITLEVDYI